MSQDKEPSKSLADEIQHFKDELSHHDDKSIEAAKAALRAKIFESEPDQQEEIKNEVDEKIEQFIREQEEQRQAEERSRKEREEAIRLANLADPKNLESANFELQPNKPEDPEAIYHSVEDGLDEEARQAQINENIELHLQLQQEIEEKKRQEKERQKELERQRQAMAGGNFAASGRRREATGFAEITDDITKKNFLKQQIVLSDYVFVIEGMEALFLSVYFIVFPYVTGLMVLFFFVAQRDISNFLVFDIWTVIPIWAIGYEALAAFIMLMITKSWLSFYLKKQRALKKKEKALRNKIRRMEKSRTKFR